MVGALGVVYGDIGTSPLYAMQSVFGVHGGAVQSTPGDVFDVVSLIFLGWADVSTLVFQTGRQERIDDYADTSGEVGEYSRGVGIQAWGLTGMLDELRDIARGIHPPHRLLRPGTRDRLPAA